jgi:hypothetical protein
MGMRFYIAVAAFSAATLQAAEDSSSVRPQPVDASKLPQVEQRTIIPLPSERLPAPTAPSLPSNSTTPAPYRQPDAKTLEKQEKEKNWLIEGMEAKRAERELPAANAPKNESQQYLDGYIREQQLLQKMPSTTAKPDDGTYRPALAPPAWSELGLPQNKETGSNAYQPSLAGGFGTAAGTEPFADASLTLHNNATKPSAPLLGPPQQTQQANNEYRPPVVPGVSDSQQNNIKLLSKDPNALPSGYQDPVERLRTERQQSSQPAPQPILSREEIERRLSETSRPRPKATDLRRSIPDPTSLDY